MNKKKKKGKMVCGEKKRRHAHMKEVKLRVMS